MQLGQKEMAPSGTLAWHNHFWWSLTGAIQPVCLCTWTFTVRMLKVKRWVYKINVLSWEFYYEQPRIVSAKTNMLWPCTFAISVTNPDWETVFYCFVTQFSNTPEASNIILASDLNSSLEMASDGKIWVMNYSLME